MLLKSSVSALALGVALVSGSAYAYQAGDAVVRVGAAAVDPREDSSMLYVNGVSTKDALGVDSSAGVNSDTQLGLTLDYMVTNHIGFELLAATPFSHTVTAHIDTIGTVKAAKVKHLPPTLTAQYFFMDPTSKFQPYVGLGLNYTTFFDEKVSPELNAVTQSLGIPGEGKLKLDDSFGFAAEVGCDYAVTDRVVVNASVWKASIKTKAKFSYSDGTKITTDVNIDPMVYMLAVGYKF